MRKIWESFDWKCVPKVKYERFSLCKFARRPTKVWFQKVGMVIEIQTCLMHDCWKIGHWPIWGAFEYLKLDIHEKQEVTELSSLSIHCVYKLTHEYIICATSCCMTVESEPVWKWYVKTEIFFRSFPIHELSMVRNFHCALVEWRIKIEKRIGN